MKLRSQVVLSIFKRNFSSYFSGVLGYLFIIVFVVAGGAMAFSAQFFTANEPTLDQLTEWFPLLLLFLVPAITMTTWADERKLGTAEILFTLPVTDLEILLGKYLAVLAVYSVTLLFSTTYVIVLTWLGDPDWGLLFSTYFGYWMSGAALLSAGMLASVLTAIPTVAYILGVVICGIPVFFGYVGGLTDFFTEFRSGDTTQFTAVRELFTDLSLQEQMRDFGMGVVPVSATMYFLAFIVLMLYLNFVFITKRHWSSNQQVGMGMQFSVRSVCLAVILVCCTAWAGYAALRVDATSERLFSLSDITRSTLSELNPERPIEIQAFLSPEVPREYVDTRKQLVGLLRQYDRLGGNGLAIRFVDVTEFSPRADEAEHFGIEPVRLFTDIDGRRTEVEVFLGAVVISSYDKVVVPFFGKGLPIEYELTRSLRTVLSEERHTIGILETDPQLMGSREWQIVTELRKQYDVESVSPMTEIDAEQFDVLLAVMPSSLTEPQMDNFVNYIKAGHPALIFDDPYPMAFSTQFGVANAPRHGKPRPGGHMAMFGGGGGPPPEQKADGGRATRLLDALDIRWDYDTVVFDAVNPHPEYESLDQEYVFITRDSNPDAFNPESAITKDLEQTLLIFSGSVQQRHSEGREYNFTELMKTSGASGRLAWDEFATDRFDPFSMQSTAVPRENRLWPPDEFAHVLAAHIESDSEDDERNVIFVPDMDMVSDFFFQSRVFADLDLKFDNVSFVLNAVDILAEDDSVVALRSRRPRHRSLTHIEQQKRQFLNEASRREQKADEEAKEELESRRTQLAKRLTEIRENADLDPVVRAQLEEQAEAAEQQRLNLAEAQIEQDKNYELRRIRKQTNREIQSVISKAQLFSIFIAPIPAICLGLLVFGMRLNDEKRHIVDTRRRD